MSGPPMSEIPELGIEPDSQPVAEELGGEDDQEDARPGEAVARLDSPLLIGKPRVTPTG